MERRFSKIPLRELRTYSGSRAVRLPGFDYSSEIDVHVTIRAEQPNITERAAFASELCASIETTSRLLAYRLYGFCLMPDHLHALLSPAASGQPLQRWLQKFKSYTGHRWVAFGGVSPLWQRSANDHVCRSEESAEAVLAYIVNNPVRAELARNWEDWPWTKVFIKI
ncbi:MAG: transposase [Planctomycetes bacterium]|nr:transposase [Planctomycetota bacterium]